MKSFKQFISEAPQYVDHSEKIHIDDGEDYNPNPHPHGWATTSLKDHMDVAKKIANYDDDHHLYKYKNRYSGSTVYALHNHKTDMVTMQVSGPEYRKSFTTNNLESHSKRTTKAVDFYKHLIHHHGLTLVSGKEHTKGSRDLWEKLHKDPEIRVTIDKKKPDSNWMNNYKGENKFNKFIAKSEGKK